MNHEEKNIGEAKIESVTVKTSDVGATSLSGSATVKPDVLDKTAKAKDPANASKYAKDPAKVLPKLPPLPSVLPEGSDNIFSYVYKILAFSPLITLSIIFVLQTIFTLDARALWFSDEIRHANVLQYMLQNNDWLLPHLNGQLYPDKPPLYFWLLACVQWLLPLLGFNVEQAAPMVLFTGVAFSGLLFLWATMAFSKFVVGLDRSGRLAAGLVLLSVCSFVSFLHYARMDLFFAALIVTSATLIFLALQKEKSMLFMIAGFFLAGLSVLVKGPLGLAFPLLTAIIYASYTGKHKRLASMDFLVGLAVSLLPAAAWAVALWFGGHEDFVKTLIGTQIVERTVDAVHHKEPWFHYLMTFPLVWLPWTFLVFFLPWHRLFTKNTIKLLADSRIGARQGMAFAWIMLISGVVMLSLISTKIPIYLLPLFAPLAVLCGRSVLQLSPFRAKLLQRTSGIFFILLGGLMLLVPIYFGGHLGSIGEKLTSLGVTPWDIEINGTIILCGILIVGGSLLLAAVNPNRPEALLLMMALIVGVFSYPLATITMPSIDAAMSPKAQGTVMREYMDKGYYPVTFSLYSGTYSYYTNGVQEELPRDWEKLNSTLLAHDKVVLAMTASKWQDWQDNYAKNFNDITISEVHRQWIADRRCVLLVKDKVVEKAVEAAPGQLEEAGSHANQPAGETGQNTPDTNITPQVGEDLSMPDTPSATIIPRGQAVQQGNQKVPAPDISRVAPGSSSIPQESTP